MRNKETKAHTLCNKKIHNFKNKNWKLKKKHTLICILINDWPEKKTTHVNIMRFYLITWYFSRSNLSWIVMNRRSNRLQKKQEHKYDLYYCTCMHRQHQNVVRTTDWHTWGSKVSMFFTTFLMSTAINNNCTNTWQNVISLFCICDHMAPRVHQYPHSPYSSL